MRLLNVKSKRILWFPDKAVPRYVILSHTWGEKEIIFQDFEKGIYTPELKSTDFRPSYLKIEGCCSQARKDGYEWAWVDTCCIDKTSSAELSEAISSMFRWYQTAEVCYVYLNDFPHRLYASDKTSVQVFNKARWLTRGWTLQELIAPHLLKFFNSTWDFIDKVTPQSSQSEDKWLWPPYFLELLSERLDIDPLYISNPYALQTAGVAERLRWAAKRSVTKAEDQAYSLMGLFDVHMPMLYGEGGEKAFQRLQREILTSNNDHTIFAWTTLNSSITGHRNSMFADSPAPIAHGWETNDEWAGLRSFTPQGWKETHITMTNVGVRMKMRLRKLPIVSSTYLGMLHCGKRDVTTETVLAIPLEILPKGAGDRSHGVFTRIASNNPVLMPITAFGSPEAITPQIYIADQPSIRYFYSGLAIDLGQRTQHAGTHGATESFELSADEVYPPSWAAILNGGTKIAMLINDGVHTSYASSDFGLEAQNRIHQEIIYVGCRTSTATKVLLKVNYQFSVSREDDVGAWYARNGRLTPLSAEWQISSYRSLNGSLAELMLRHGDRFDKALDWAKTLILNDHVLSFTARRARVVVLAEDKPRAEHWQPETHRLEFQAVPVQTTPQVRRSGPF